VLRVYPRWCPAWALVGLSHRCRLGAADDGLIQRFQLAVWPDAPPTWRNVDTWPDSAAKHRAAEVFRRLDQLDVAQLGAERDGDSLPFLRFDSDAQGLFDVWRGELEQRLRSGSEHPAIKAHLAKYRSLVPSLALICHLADGGAGSVPQEAMARAAAWAEYLEGHAQRIYRSVTQVQVEAARRLAAKLLGGELPTPFLDWLAEEVRPTSGRRKIVYRLNPRVREVADELA
jgi:hypothetical protein